MQEFTTCGWYIVIGAEAMHGFGTDLIRNPAIGLTGNRAYRVWIQYSSPIPPICTGNIFPDALHLRSKPRVQLVTIELYTHDFIAY